MTEVQWFDDHYIDENGKRWALSVPWDADCAGCGLPAFLIITEEQRRAAWEGVSLTDAYRGGKMEDWQKREWERRKQMRAEKQAKSAKSLAKLKAKHKGERYDRKAKQWVRIDNGEPEHQAEELEERPGVRPGDGQQEE